MPMDEGETADMADDLALQGEPDARTLAEVVQMCDAQPEVTKSDGSTDAGHAWLLAQEVMGIDGSDGSDH